MTTTTCDYCHENASHAICACPGHVKVLDKVASRRTDHLLKYIHARDTRQKNKIKKLKARIKELEDLNEK